MVCNLKSITTRFKCHLILIAVYCFLVGRANCKLLLAEILWEELFLVF